MTFTEALETMKRFDKVRRPNWEPHEYIHIKVGMLSNYIATSGGPWKSAPRDVLADDWEIVK